ncbi:MAG: monovalent cation/H+ antiporter complex subunit F [Propionicimonas sp.]|nr:monovalent cation/H+ antiporter complex subunit F [Propionicimonas sp.]
MTVALWIAAASLFAAAWLVLYRMVRGPTPLDRIVAADVMVAIMIAGVGIYTVVAGNATGLPILLALSLVGFTGSVGVARLIASSRSVRRAFDRRQAMDAEDADDS